MGRILVIGDSCIDRYHFGECSRLSPEAPVAVFKHVYSEDRPGMAGNVLNNLRAFGHELTFWTNVDKPTKERFIDMKSKHHLLRADFAEQTLLPPLKPSVIGGEDYSKFDAVVISDYNKGFLTPSVIKGLLSFCRDLPVFVDTKKTDLSIFENCILKINHLENNRVIKFPHQYELIVTAGRNGAIWKDVVFPLRKPTEVFDVCGAGDVFLSALVSGYLENRNIIDAIGLANKCASYSVSKFGTYVITKEDIEFLWDQRKLK